VADERIYEWLEGQADRLLEKQRAEVDNSKLVATFVTAVAATIVATALQVHPVSVIDLLAAIGLIWCTIATWKVIEADRLSVADHLNLMTVGKAAGEDADGMLRTLRQGTLGAVDDNETVVKQVRTALRRVLLAAAVGSGLALVSLLYPILSHFAKYLIHLVGK
jgi:hypothetical protein